MTVEVEVAHETVHHVRVSVVAHARTAKGEGAVGFILGHEIWADKGDTLGVMRQVMDWLDEHLPGSHVVTWEFQG